MNNGSAANADGPAGVLICDDNDSVRALLGVIVDTSPGLHVIGFAVDGVDVVLQATRLQPDVILLDLAMPNKSGLEALPELRKLAPGAEIVVFSGFSSSAVAEEVMALGAAAHVEKGAHPDAIVAAIEKALAERAGERPLAGSLAESPDPATS